MNILGLFRKRSAPPRREPTVRPRSYNAAAKVARYADFKSSPGSADYELRNSLAELRGKARFLARNSASMVRFIGLMRVNVVGPSGFRFQSRVRKIDGSPDVALNARVERRFAKWCRRCSADGKWSLRDLSDQAIATWCRDGEIIWEMVFGNEYPDQMAVNPIESDMLDETLNTINPATQNEIRMGVEINRRGRPVAYHFLTTHPGDYHYAMATPEKRHRRVTADRVLHAYIPLRPGQTRGEPPVSSTANSVKMLDGYREAEVMARRIAAAAGGFFTRDTQTAEGIAELATGTDETGEMLEMDITPGTFKELPAGLNFAKFDPGGSVTDYAQFESQVKKDISMGAMISAFSLGMETSGVSYSTGRSVLIEDRDYYKVMQQFLIDHLMSPVFGRWVQMSIMSDDADSIPPTRTGVVIDKHVFRPRGWDWVDPAKDVKANTEALRTKQTSLSRIAAKLGMDRDELLDEIVDDERAAADRGLTLTYDDDTTGQKVEDSENGDRPDET